MLTYNNIRSELNRINLLEKQKLLNIVKQKKKKFHFYITFISL